MHEVLDRIFCGEMVRGALPPEPERLDTFQRLPQKGHTSIAFRKMGTATLVLSLVMLCSAPSFAGTKLAFKQQFADRYVSAGACTWKGLGNVKIAVPGAGYVVVTAAGMTSFDSDAFLTVSLGAKSSFQTGDWLFTLSPGPAPNLNYQSYSARMVFPVSTAATYTFHFRGRSCAPSQTGTILVQTGSMTAEFYPSANVQPQAILGSETEDSTMERETKQTAPEGSGERALSDLSVN
jgi:hypothetical protein